MPIICQFTIGYPDPFPRGKGQQFTLSIDPVPGAPADPRPFQPGCEFTVSVDGRRVQPGDTVGDFRCVGLGGSGTATFENLRDDPTPAKFEFMLTCQDCGPTPESVALPPPIINAPPAKKGCLGMLIGPIFLVIAARSGS